MRDHEELESLMQRALSEALLWKGRALAATPALRIALSAIETLDYLQCPWCGEMFEHLQDCSRELAIKVLKEALRGQEMEGQFQPQGKNVFGDLKKGLWTEASPSSKVLTVFLLVCAAVLVTIILSVIILSVARTY